MKNINIKNLSPNQPIGIFDSGVGGLTTAREVKKMMPHEDLIYFGDTKHLPYGDKSKEAIIEYSVKITKFLLSQNCKAIVIACNTATANALKEIKATVDNTAFIFDVINPVAEKVAYELHQNVGVIATKATVGTGIYKKSIKKFNKFINVHELATPLIVPAIEEGYINHPITKTILANYLSNKKLSNIETIILGCTHYPLVSNEIKQFYHGNVKIVNSPAIVANEVRHVLEKNNLLNPNMGNAKYEFYLSDITKNFQKISKKFFGNKIHLQLKML